MRIDPAIAAMQRDPGLRRRAQVAMLASADGWRGEAQVAAVLAGLDAFGAGSSLDNCGELHDVFVDPVAALRLAAGLCSRFVAELEREPLAQLPFRHGFDGAISTILLAISGRAQLVLHGHEPGASRFASADYADAQRHEMVLAGKAEARIVRRADDGFVLEPLILEPGARLALDLSREALQVLAVERRLVTLRLHRPNDLPDPSCSFALPEGTVLHRAAGAIAASRCEMMLAVLGRMNRAEAAPTLAAMAREQGDDSLRWQALRESLALDAAEGFPALCAVADDGEDSLAGPAGALRAQLLETWPVLQSLESDRCRE